MAQYKRKENETILDWIERLVENKKEYYLESNEIYDMVTNITLSSDESRKRLYGWLDLIEILKKESIPDISEDELFEKIEKKKLELYKERMKLSTLRLDLNRQYRDEARRELILEEIKRIIPTVPETSFKVFDKIEENKEYMLCLTDIHYNSIFKSVNNEYSIDIVHRRFEKLLGEVIDFIQKENISKLYIANLGDSLQGLIRISDLRKNQVGLLESLIQFSRFMGDFLNKLSEYVNIEYYHVPTANHSDIRLFDSSKDQTGENLELVIVNYIYAYLKENKRVNVILPIDNKDYHELNILGYDVILLHGHQLSKSKSNLDALSSRSRKFYDYVVLGHFHGGKIETVSEGKTNDKEYIIAPSIVGSDPYSDELLVGAKSAAVMLTFKENAGLYQQTKFILN